MATHGFEQFEIAINTPAGQLTTMVEVPTGFIPVTSIVPLMRRLGQEAQALEVARSADSGKPVSCSKGCAACCRMLVPLSAPEALALREWVLSLPDEQQRHITSRVAQLKFLLLRHGLWQQLSDLCDAERQPDDDSLETLNRAYYALRLPCPFLQDELCMIYDERPAACRELLVFSPPERCEDLLTNPEPISAPIRVSTVSALLWQDLTNTSTKLIPLPLALDWAARHQQDNRQTWRGTELLDRALDKVWRFLSQSFQGNRSDAPK